MATPYYFAAVDEQKTLVHAGPTMVRSISVINADDAVRYLHLFDAVSVAAVTLGTTAPRYVLGMRASSAGPTDHFEWPKGLYFAAGLVAAVKTVGTTAGTTGPTADAIMSVAYG